MSTFRYFTAAALVSLSVVSFAKNPVLVDSGGTGDFTTVQAAINSWCVGGANYGETAPFVINIKAGTTYDEALTLDSRIVYAAGTSDGGNIKGAIVIKSDTVGSPVTLKLRNGATADTTKDDGLTIWQDDKDVTFKDIVFTRSIQAPLFTDEMVRVDEIAANDVANVYTFENCVFTQVKADGEPMVTSKAQALVGPPPTRGGSVAMGTGARLLQIYPDAGEAMKFVVRNCTFYGGSSTHATLRLDGSKANGETGLVENCLSAYAGYNAYEFGTSGATNLNATVTVTGTDQKAGPLNCTAALWQLLDGHGIMCTNEFTINVSKMIIYGTTTNSRGYSGGAARLTLSDAIINVPHYGVVDNLNTPTTWDRVTVRSAAQRAHYSGVAGTGSFTIRDSIIAGPGAAAAGAFGGTKPTGGATIDNSCIVQAGTFAIGTIGAGVDRLTNMTYVDPVFANTTDPSLATFMDVSASALAGLGTAGSNIGGGANYTGPNANVEGWSSY